MPRRIHFIDSSKPKKKNIEKALMVFPLSSSCSVEGIIINFLALLSLISSCCSVLGGEKESK